MIPHFCVIAPSHNCPGTNEGIFQDMAKFTGSYWIWIIGAQGNALFVNRFSSFTVIAMHDVDDRSL